MVTGSFCKTSLRFFIEKATASAADLLDPRLGCLDAWMLGCLSFCLPGVRFETNLSDILEAFDHLSCLLQALVPFGLHWSSQGAQMSYLALLCRREHRFREICWILGQKVGRPVAACGGLLHPSRAPKGKIADWRPQAAACRSLPGALQPGGADARRLWEEACLQGLLGWQVRRKGQ